MQRGYHPEMANKGRALEDLIIWKLRQYNALGIANIQKISTPWKVIRQGKQIVSAFPEGKSTLDFRGTAKGDIPVSFDAKESEESKGLPLKYIKSHQIDYIRGALPLGELTFLVVWVKPTNAYYIARGEDVIRLWDLWKENKGRRGFNLIPVEKMLRIPGNMDFLGLVLKERMETMKIDSGMVNCRFCQGGQCTYSEKPMSCVYAEKREG